MSKRAARAKHGDDPSGVSRGDSGLPPPGTLLFQCNVCGSLTAARLAELGRETESCHVCASTVRTRAIVHILSLELFGEGLILPEFPTRPDVVGIGLSDWQGYAERLAERLNYTNTFYHLEPRLDIMVGAPERETSLDFLISSEVFEHVAPPVAAAFEQSCRLLKPGGVLVLSVPFQKESEHQEHFPDLNDYEIEECDGRTRLRNVTRDGVLQLFEDPVFHGGVGTTLEMRVFSEASLIGLLLASGFTNIQIHHQPVFEHGIYWHSDWSLPISARRA